MSETNVPAPEADRTHRPEVPRTISDALTSVFYGNYDANDCLRALYSGRGRNATPLVVRGEPRSKTPALYGLYTWVGGVPGRVGCYFVPNPYRVSAVPLDDWYALERGTGLTDDGIGMICAVMGEDDEGTLHEQAARWDAIEAETGIRAANVVLSGDARPESIAAAGVDPEEVLPGKSIHWTVAIDWTAPTPEALVLRQELADMICAISYGDPQVRNIGRKQRMGSVAAARPYGTRIQSALRALPCHYPLRHAHHRFRIYCERHGIDVRGRIASLYASQHARTRAAGRQEALDESADLPKGYTAAQVKAEIEECLALAERIHTARAVTDTDRALLKRLPLWHLVGDDGSDPKASKGGTAARGGRPRVQLTRDGAVPDLIADRDGRVYDRDGLRTTLRTSHSGKVPVVCPGGLGHLDNRNSCYSHLGRDGRIHIRCSSCGSHFIEDAPDADLTADFCEVAVVCSSEETLKKKQTTATSAELAPAESADATADHAAVPAEASADRCERLARGLTESLPAQRAWEGRELAAHRESVERLVPQLQALAGDLRAGDTSDDQVAYLTTVAEYLLQAVPVVQPRPEIRRYTTPTSGTGAYLPPTVLHVPARVIALDCDMGSGKSTVLRQMVDQAEGATVITPSRLLSRIDGAEYGGDVAVYMDQDGVIGRDTDKAIVCVLSAMRRPVAAQVGRVLVIEEIDECLDLLHSGLAGSESGPLHVHMQGLVTAASTVVVTGDRMSERAIRELGRWGVPAEDIVVVEHRRPAPIDRVVMLATAADAIRQVHRILRAGGRVMVPCSWKSDAEGIVEMAISAWGLAPDECVAIHADTDEHVREGMALGFNAFVEGKRLVTYNKALSSGASLDLPGWSVVQIERSSGGHTPMLSSMSQRTRRTRAPEGCVVYAYITDHVSAPRSQSAIETDMAAQVRDTKTAIAKWVRTEDGEVIALPRCDAHWESRLDKLTRESAERASPRASWTGRWASQGATVIDQRAAHEAGLCDLPLPAAAGKQVNQAMRKLAQARKSKAADRVAVARTITESVFQGREATWCKDATERAEVERYRLLDTFGEAEAELALADTKRKVTEQTSRLVDLGLLAEQVGSASDTEGIERLLRHDARELRLGYDAHATHRARTVGTLYRLLVAGPVNPLGLVSDLQIGFEAETDDFAGVQPAIPALTGLFPKVAVVSSADVLPRKKQTTATSSMSDATGSQESQPPATWTAEDVEQLRKVHEQLAEHPPSAEALRRLGLAKIGPSITAFYGRCLHAIGLRSTNKGKVRVYQLDEARLHERLELARRMNRRRRGFHVPSAVMIGVERPEEDLLDISALLRRDACNVAEQTAHSCDGAAGAQSGLLTNPHDLVRHHQARQMEREMEMLANRFGACLRPRVSAPASPCARNP